LAKDVNGQKVCKEVDEEFLKNNLTKQYWEALLDHDKNKGWVTFSNDDVPQYYEENKLEELKNAELQPIYTFTSDERNDKILVLRIKMELEEIDKGVDGFSYNLKPGSFSYAIKTSQSTPRYRSKSFVELDIPI
jgi:hypothetical protein